jgi:FKBP-type peptidyl-prolyl cis-trans isomerase FklB
MRFSIAAAVGLGLALVTAASGQQPPAGGGAPAAAPGGLSDLKSKASYGVGLSVGNDFKAKGLKLDPKLVAQGLSDALSGAKPLLSETELRQVLTQYFQELQSEMQVANKSVAERNQKEGVAFLAANKSKPGVVTLPSGLQYKVLREGTGASPQANSTVKVHYAGKLLDGTEFDSSYKRGEPIDLQVNGVIRGWTEALQKMKEGAKWQLFIPGDLAYGASPRPGGPIGPNAVLLFDVELIKVVR